jgi:hypothetical protein
MAATDYEYSRHAPGCTKTAAGTQRRSGGGDWDSELAPAMESLCVALHEESALDLLLEVLV